MAFNILEIVNFILENNSVNNFLLVAGIFVGLSLIFKIIKTLIIVKLEKLSKRTKTKADDIFVDALKKLNWPFYFAIALYISLQFLILPEVIGTGLYYLILIIIVYYAVKTTQIIIEHNINRIIAKKEKEGVDPSIIKLLKAFAKIILWATALLLILSNLGYNISALIAGLGIGGIAIALALQNILGDLFSSLSILLDKPFEIGDFIIVGDDLGIVKKIGIRSTRIESLWGQELVFSNRELTSLRINNYKKMKERRIHFSFGVTYETSTLKLKKIPKIMKEIFDKIEEARLDRVHFKEFGDFSLNFQTAYYINTGDYNRYMDIQQEINLALKEKFEKECIDFAYPTQTVFVNKKK